MQAFGFCPKCHTMQPLTEHHVFPKRFYGNSNNDSKLKLCAECHKDIKRVLPKLRKLIKSEYILITRAWLLGYEPKVSEQGNPYN